MNFLLVGRPNVGKSSIFNLLVKDNLNIIHSRSGTTRDWHVSKIKNNININLYDTPGLIFDNSKIIKKNFEILLKKIETLIYVIDYKVLNYDNDKELINLFRKYNKKFLLIVNKDDNFEKNKDVSYLGIDNIFYLSCTHRSGLEELINYFKMFEDSKNNFEENSDFSIGIYGKTNVGKSTLLNKLVGFNRSTVSNIPKTTTDVVKSFYIYKSKKYSIQDTAGLIKKNKIDKNSLDFYATKKTISIIKNIDINLFIIDVEQGFDTQSKKIFNILFSKSNLIVIIVNKIDILKNNQKKIIIDLKKDINTQFSKSKNIHIFPISALKNKDVSKLKNFINALSKDVNISLSTSKINEWIKKVTSDYPHSRVNGKVVKFKYGTQVSKNPLTIKIFTNFSKKIKDSYKKYLLNNFCQNFNIKSKNINFLFSKTSNPFK